MGESQKIGYASAPLGIEKLRIVAAVFFVLLSALYLWGHHWYGLFDVDEAIFTQASIEMRASGDYVAPTYNGAPRYHKPPLIYWVQAASLNIFGTHSLLGARLPSALFGLATVIGFFLFLWRFLGQDRQALRFALTASAVLGLNLSWLVVVRAATADAALNFFILMSTCCLLSLLYGHARLWKQVLAGFLLAGGMLAKGPIALLVPGVVVLTVWLCKPHRRNSFWATNPFVIGAAFIAGILPWFVVMVGTQGWDFFVEFWLVHNWGRFTGDLGNSQSGSYFYYLFVLLFGFFPWIFYVLIFALSLRPGKIIRALCSHDAKEALPILGLVWASAVILFFSFSGTKLAHYIVPALPGLALFIAAGTEKLPAHLHGLWHKCLFLPITVLLAALFLVLNPLLYMLRSAALHEPSGLFLWLQRLFSFEWPPEDKLALAVLAQDVPLNLAPYALAGVLIFGVLLGLSVAARGFRHGIAVVAISMWLALGLILAGVVPTIDNYAQASLRALATQIKAQDLNVKVYHLGLHKPSVRLLSGRWFRGLDTPAQLPDRLQPGAGIILFEAHRFNVILAAFPASVVWQPPVCKGGYCVLNFVRN